MKYAWKFRPFDPADPTQDALWADLHARCLASVVQLPEFVFPCARTMATAPLTLAVCECGGMVVAAALLDRRRRLLPEVFVAPQMPLGAWLQLPSHDFVRLAGSLLAADGLALRLGALQLDSRFVGRPSDRARATTLDYIDTPWVEIGGGFDAYWAARGKNLRTNMRKQRDRLAEQAVQTRMEILRRPQDMARAVADYAALESKGWKAEGGTALSEEHPQTRFYREMLARCAQRDVARIYRYFFSEQLVATELCLEYAGELAILKTTYDESITWFSPASLLRQEMFAELFGRQTVGRVEFYGPLKDWHKRWTELARGVYHANVYRSPALLGLERGARRLLGRDVVEV